MRNRQLVAKWAYEKGREQNVIERIDEEGKTYFVIRDYEALRELFGQHLREVQRIISQGDFAAGRDMVEAYGVQVDRELRQSGSRSIGRTPSGFGYRCSPRTGIRPAPPDRSPLRWRSARSRCSAFRPASSKLSDGRRLSKRCDERWNHSSLEPRGRASSSSAECRERRFGRCDQLDPDRLELRVRSPHTATSDVDVRRLG